MVAPGTSDVEGGPVTRVKRVVITAGIVLGMLVGPAFVGALPQASASCTFVVHNDSIVAGWCDDDGFDVIIEINI